jgi:hypothetical protein
MNETEHLNWAKARALEYVDRGDCKQAYVSMRSDISKHEALYKRYRPYFATVFDSRFHSGQLSTPKAMREWIEGFSG